MLVSGKFLERTGRAKKKTPRLLGFGHTTDYLPLNKKDAPTFSIARKAAEKAFGMANIKPRDLDGADVHDCFSVTEIVVYEILGLAEPGKGADLAKSGATALPQVRNEKMRGPFAFEIPVNPGGGLIGDGHPVGASRRASGLRSVSASERASRCPTNSKRKTFPHLQHGRESHDICGDDLGSRLSMAAKAAFVFANAFHPDVGGSASPEDDGNQSPQARADFREGSITGAVFAPALPAARSGSAEFRKADCIAGAEDDRFFRAGVEFPARLSD